MGPNSQVVRRPSSPIKTGNYSPINGPHSEEPFNSGSEITLGPSNPPQERGLLASNHRLISGISENEFSSSSSSCNIVERSVSICNHKSKHQQQQLKNGHRKYNNNQEQRKHFKRIFKCNFCGYVTDRRNNLARHVSTMHDACKQLLECCGMRFESKATFRYHINECHREGYSCAICGHNFHRKALLKRHMSIHSGRKEFSCTKCNYGTSHKSNLERHKKVHSKEMPSNRKKESVEHGTKEDEEEEKKSPPPPPLPSPTRLPYPKAATTVPTNHMTSPREGTSPSDVGLPLKKRLLRLGDNSEPVSMVENDKYVVRYDEWSDRNTAVEQTQPIDLHKEQHKHGSNTDLVHMHPLNGGVPWTLLTPAIYSYKTTVPQHVSYPNLYSVDPQYQYQHHHEGANSRMEHWNGEEHRIYTDNHHHQQQQQQQEVERRSFGTGKKRIMATPYKCFECNCRLSSQFALAVHLQSYHPMADVVTLSIVTLLNNMNKVKNRNKVPSNEDSEDRCQYQKEELQEFLLAQL